MARTSLGTFDGGDELRRVIRELGPRASRAVARALYQQGEVIMTEAKKRTPVDTGALRASGHVHPLEITAGQVAVLLGFGGPSAPYAIYVHENLHAHHPVGQAKFLESAVLEAASTLGARLAEVLRAELEG